MEVQSIFVGFKSQFIEMTGDPRTNPKSWPVKTLSELATYSIGLTYKPENISEEGTIVLRSGNIQNSKIDLADVVRVNCPIKESIYVQKNDILMCSRNGSAALVGKVAQIKDISEPMTYGAFMTVIRSEYSDFLYLYFQCNDFREQVSTGKSSTMNQITQNMLDKISLPLPDDETRNKLSIILHQADKSGFDELKSQFIEMFKGCKMIPLKKVACFSKASINPIEGVKYTLYSFPAFDNNCIPEIVDGGDIKSSKLKLEENVILYNKLNVRLSRVWNINELSSNNNVCSSEFLPIKVVNKDLITKSFLYRILCSEDVTKKMVACSTGTSNSQKRISPASLLSLDIPIPPMEEQMKFVAIAKHADKSGFRTQQIH